MRCYRICSRLLAPFMIQRSRQTFTPQTVNYLLGSTLRGALAGHYLRTGGRSEDAEFQKLFGPEGPSFPDLLPASSGSTDTFVLPLTAVSCKRFPGLSHDGGHGVRDSLSILTFNRMTGEGRPAFWNCPVCGNTCVPFSGYYTRHPDPESDAHGTVKGEQTTIVLQRHTGIDRYTGTVAQRIFYASQVVREEDPLQNPQYFVGQAFLSQEQYQILQSFLQKGPVFAGADRARGLGEMEITLQECEPRQPEVEKWSAGWLRKYAMDTEQELPAGIYFSLTLASPAVLVDRFLRPTSELHLDFPNVSLVGKAAKKTLVRGWQAAWGLPKPDDYALAQGSVFVFCYQGDDLTDLEAYLGQLSVRGIGLRRQEGLGAVQICDHLHCEEVL